MAEELIELIRRAMTGDKVAFEKLVWRYKNHIVNIAFGIVGNPHDAEEVAQEAFLKAYLSIGKLKSEAAFYRWLVKIVVNLSVNKKLANVKRYAQQIEVTASLVEQWHQLPEEILEQKENQIEVLQALEQLNLEQRITLVLRELHGFTYDEIAEILAIPLGTVKSRINTARAKLRDILKNR